MKPLKRHQSKLWVLPVVALAVTVLLWSLKPAEAQIMGSLPTIWDIPIPAVSAGSVLRMSGTYVCGAKPNDCVPPLIEARLRLIHPNGFFDVTDRASLVVNANKKLPGVFTFHAVMPVGNTGFFQPGELGAGGLTLAITDFNGHRNQAHLTAGVYVEETSAAGKPLFASYSTWLAEPRPDPSLGLLFQ